MDNYSCILKLDSINFFIEILLDVDGLLFVNFLR